MAKGFRNLIKAKLPYDWVTALKEYKAYTAYVNALYETICLDCHQDKDEIYNSIICKTNWMNKGMYYSGKPLDFVKYLWHSDIADRYDFNAINKRIEILEEQAK